MLTQKKLWLSFLVLAIALLIIANGLVFASEYTHEEITSVASELYSRMNLQKQEVVAAVSLYNSGDYLGFLKEIRNISIDNLRKEDFGEFMWHNMYQISNYYMDIASYTVGEMTLEQFKTKYNGQEPFKALQSWGVVGSPYNPITPDFFTLGASNDNGYMRFQEFTPLAARYWKNGEEMYLDKWFQIMEAYSDNFFNEARERFKDVDESPNELRPLKYGYASLLACGHRTDFLIKQFALIAKSLPGDYTKTADYMNVLQGVSGNPYPSSYDLIDPVQAGKFILAMERDHFDYLFTGYLEMTRTQVPNQFLMGLNGMTHVVRAFDYFTSIDNNKTKLSEGIYDYFNKFENKDGAGSEQAFNYNILAFIDLYNLQRYANKYKTEYPALTQIDKYISNSEKLYEAIRTPLGRRPNVGGGETISPQRAWESDVLYNQAVDSAGWGTPPQYGGFTSIAFPYAGYYVLRNGWDKDSTYLFTQNARRTFGHLYVSNNSIELISKRRNLIMGGGMPYYTQGDAPEGFNTDWRKYVDYFGEAANMSRSTVVVNGKPQLREANGGIADTVENFTAIRSKWKDSDLFTYNEGNYTGGYIDASGVGHYRQTILIKALDMVIVSDIMDVPQNETHDISQVWCFPPYLTSAIDGITVAGFKENEVVYNSADKLLSTKDSTGPNVFLKFFSNFNLNATKYYGHKSDTGYYLGWFSPSISGKKYPKVDMHLTWSGTQSTTPLVSAVSSSLNTSSTVSNYVDLSNGSFSGFTADAENKKIAYFSAKSPQVFTFSGVSVQATTLLIVEEDGSLKGLVTDCQDFKIEGTSKIHENDSFEFQINNSDLINLGEISYNISFKWEEGENGIYPVTNLPDDSIIYKLSFDSMGGTRIESQNMYYNAYATLPIPPTKIGYAFAGWFADSGLTSEFDFKTPIVEHMTLYAKWTLDAGNISLAHGLASTSYSQSASGFWNSLTNAFDGDNSTYVSRRSSTAYPVWIGVDFGKQTSFNQIEITDNGGTIKDYDISVSDTGLDGSWTTVSGTKTNFSMGLQESPLTYTDILPSTLTGKYMRFSIKAPADGYIYGVYLYELKLRYQGLVLGTPILVDGNNLINTKLYGGKTLKARVGIYNPTAEAKNFKLILASYKNNLLKEVAVSDLINISSGGKAFIEVPDVLTMPADVTGTEVKVFLWDNANVPYIPKKTYSIIVPCNPSF